MAWLPSSLVHVDDVLLERLITAQEILLASYLAFVLLPSIFSLRSSTHHLPQLSFIFIVSLLSKDLGVDERVRSSRWEVRFCRGWVTTRLKK